MRLLKPLLATRSFKPLLATAAAACLAVPLVGVIRREASPTTDYEIELARLDRDIAELRDDASGAPPDVDRATSVAHRLFRRAVLTGGAEDFRAADAAIGRTIREIGPMAGLYLLKANLDFRLHRLDETRRDLAALSRFAGDARIVALSAGLALQEGRYEAARGGYLRAIEESPTWDNLARLASWEARFGDPERADQLYQRAQDEIPAEDKRTHAWVAVQRGRREFDRGRYDRARVLYEQADRAYSGYWLVEEHIAELLGAERKFDQAVALYLRGLARAPRPELQHALGDLYVFMGDAERARPWHDQALAAYLESAGRGDVQYYHHLVRFYADVRQDGAEAVKWARKDVELRPHFVTDDGLAWALYRSGEFAAALETMDRALASGVKDAHLFFHAGMISLAAGRTTEAKRFLRTVAEMNPGYENFHAHR
jgi:tetratricopeptide (TPR) repeat protein